MSDTELGSTELGVNTRLVLAGPDNQAVELTGVTPGGDQFLGGVKTALLAAIQGGLVTAVPFGTHFEISQPDAEQILGTPPVTSEMTLADLRTPNHFRDYFVSKLGVFLGQEVDLPLPSQEHVDRGNRIKDAGFTTYEPVAFPNLKIAQGFVYSAKWQFPLDRWIYEQIKEHNLEPSALNLRQLWGWLDTSIRLDWKSNDPMYDPDMDKPLADLLYSLREKGENGGIVVPSHVRHLDPRSPFGVSADETKTVVYPALATMFGATSDQVRDLTAAEFNFIGNGFYSYLGEKRSWEWLGNIFGGGLRLIGGSRDDGGLSNVGRCPSGSCGDGIRFRPLVVSPSRA